MNEIVPHFIADITLYPSDRGGRRGPFIGDRFGCSAKLHEKDFTSWDCLILTRGERFSPSETKRFGMAFLNSEAAPLFRSMDKFLLWEGRIIGEARAVRD